MRKYFYIIAVMFAVVLSSCIKDNDSSSTGSSSSGTTPTTTSKITVMYYAVGGGDLDGDMVDDLINDINYGSNDYIKMVGEIKFSAKYQTGGSKELKAAHRGVLRFDLDNMTDLQGQGTATYDNLSTDEILDKMKTTQYSTDAALKMGTEDELVKFINWAVQTHQADKYILIIGDHGGGWTLDNDGYDEANVASKALSFDDNTNSSDVITARMLTNAIASSNLPNKRLDCFFADCCNMAQWENLYEWSKRIDYVMASVETTNGDMHQTMLSDLKYSSTNDFETILKNVTHNIIANIDSNSPYKYDNDLNLYKLSNIHEMDLPIEALKDAMVADLMANLSDVTKSATYFTSTSALTPGPNTEFEIDDENFVKALESLSENMVFDGGTRSGVQYWTIDEYKIDSLWDKNATFRDSPTMKQQFLAACQISSNQKKLLCLGSMMEAFCSKSGNTQLLSDYKSAFDKIAIARGATKSMRSDGAVFLPDTYCDISPTIVWYDCSATASNYVSSTFNQAISWADFITSTIFSGATFWSYGGTAETWGQANSWSNNYARYILKHSSLRKPLASD